MVYKSDTKIQIVITFVHTSSVILVACKSYSLEMRKIY